jgi:hypothetical protein
MNTYFLQMKFAVSQDRFVANITGYDLGDQGFISDRNGDFIICHQVQSSHGINSPVNRQTTGIHSQGIKWQYFEDNHSAPSSAEIRNVQNFLMSPYDFVVWWLGAQTLPCI